MKPLIAKSQEFLNQHERQTILVSRCVIGALGLSFIGIFACMVYQTLAM